MFTKYFELAPWQQAIVSLAIVITLILVLFWIYRLFAAVPKSKHSKNRMRVVQQLKLDNKRALVLVKYFDSTHILLIGGANDLVIASYDNSGKHSGKHSGEYSGLPLAATLPHSPLSERSQPDLVKEQQQQS